MHIFRRMSTSSARAGFSLVELITVVGIVGVLATIAIPAFTQYITLTRNKRCIADIRTIDKAITAYILERNTLPASLADVGMSNQIDPWGRAYEYSNLSLGGATPIQASDGTDLNGNDSYDLFSKGVDGVCSVVYDVPASQDDIVRYDNGSYVGERP